MCEPDEEFDFDLIEPDPNLRFFYGDEDYLRNLLTKEVERIRAKKAAIAAAKERPAS